VLNIVAESLDVGTREHHPQIAIRRYLASKRALVLLDTCEHVVDPIAKFAVELLREAPALAVLATSREPLSAEGEWLHRLTPLEVPAPDAKAEASVGGTPGMVLLIERILATGASVETRGESGQALAEICRDLGGNPLAIALAAARIGLLGPRGLLGQRASWLDLLSTPQRSGPARHQTLRATFDWSYDLLTGAEQTVLTRLSVFEGFFGLESAEAVVSDEEISPQEVVRLISELAGKSLIQPNVTLAAAGYSLQSLTRTYALEKLAAADDRSEVHLRHARHCLALARQAETEFSQEDREEWIRAFGPWLNDIRVALDWSLSASGDPTIGVALTAASAPFWFHIGALEEYQSRVERVLTLDRKVLKGNAVLELRLSLTLGYLVLNTAGPTPEMDATFARALIIADGIGDGPDRLQVLAAMTVAKLGHADYPAALQYAGRFRKAWDAIPGSQTRPFDDRLMALVLHFQGQHATARRLAERVLDMPASHRRPAHTAAVQIDRTVSMHVLLARDLWLTGSPGEAIELAHDCVSFAKSLQAGPSLCFALAMMACPIALWVGDGDSARQYTNQLVEAAAEASLFHYRGWVRCFEAAALAAGNADTLSRARLQGELPLLLTAQQDVLATFDPRFLVEQTVARANSGHAGWAAAEILRAQGEALLAGQPFAHQEAETLFLRALEIAREQGAVSWGLRAAVSLGRLWATRGRNGEAFDLVQWALDQNRDRFPTTDLQEAERLMSQLRDEDRDRVAVVAG
jgi:predicted ATPase